MPNTNKYSPGCNCCPSGVNQTPCGASCSSVPTTLTMTDTASWLTGGVTLSWDPTAVPVPSSPTYWNAGGVNTGGWTGSCTFNANNVSSSCPAGVFSRTTVSGTAWFRCATISPPSSIHGWILILRTPYCSTSNSIQPGGPFLLGGACFVCGSSSSSMTGTCSPFSVSGFGDTLLFNSSIYNYLYYGISRPKVTIAH